MKSVRDLLVPPRWSLRVQQLVADFRFDFKNRPSVRRGSFLLLGLFILNIVVGIVLLLLSRQYPILVGLAVLAWGFGLRHAMDTDHIAAIDNATRRLLYQGKPSVGVGFFFSLGHSTIVLLLTMGLVFFASFTHEYFSSIRSVGMWMSGVVASVFLVGVGIANILVFQKLVVSWKDLREGRENSYHGHMHIGGPIEKIFRPLLRLVDRSPKMYLIGFLFGLGFDTATEVGLLTLSVLATGQQVPPWAILMLPISFMAGMTFLDTINSLLMLGIYTARVFDARLQLLYNMNITAISALSALLIGTVLGLQFLVKRLGFGETGIGIFIDSLSLNNMGYILFGLFVCSWIFLFIIRSRSAISTVS